MAQHIPIEFFPQKAMQKIAESIRNTHYFESSLKYERLDDMYMENDYDQVYGTERSTPKSITGYSRNYFEIHTRPKAPNRPERIVTNIYLVA